MRGRLRAPEIECADGAVIYPSDGAGGSNCPDPWGVLTRIDLYGVVLNKRVPTSLEVSSEASVPIHLALRRQVLQDLGELGKIGSELTNLFTRLHAEVEHVTAQVEQGVRAIDIGNSIGVSNKRLLVNN